MNGKSSKAKVLDQLQYALKINANSMYDVLSFPQYNTYSPRCGMSITAMGRWALNVTCAIICCLGLEVIYGDTDSVMFTLPGMHNSGAIFAREDLDRPIITYIESISKNGQTVHSVHKCEYLSGSKGALVIADDNNQYMYGIIPKIVNYIMSYTCLTQLKVEHQETGASTSTGIMSNVYQSFVLLSKKHYTSRLFNDEMHDKGISYVRRTGSYLRNTAMRKFLRVLLETSDINSALSSDLLHSDNTMDIKDCINACLYL